LRRRGGNDPLHAGDFGDRDGHERGRDQRIASPGHVRANRADGHQAVSKSNARQRLDLEWAQGVELMARELPDAFERELKGASQLAIQGCDGALAGAPGSSRAGAGAFRYRRPAGSRGSPMQSA
jgi:hypothetical protein